MYLTHFVSLYFLGCELGWVFLETHSRPFHTVRNFMYIANTKQFLVLRHFYPKFLGLVGRTKPKT